MLDIVISLLEGVEESFKASSPSSSEDADNESSAKPFEQVFWLSKVSKES